MTIAQEARLLKQPVRRDILTMLKQQGPIGIQPLAAQLKLTHRGAQAFVRSAERRVCPHSIDLPQHRQAGLSI